MELALVVQKRLIYIIAQINPFFYWESALFKNTEVQGIFQREAAWSCLLFGAYLHIVPTHL